MVNISSYKKNKLNASIISWCKGGGGQKNSLLNSPLSLTFSCNGKSKSGGGGGKNNTMRSSISDQCYFYAKYNENASTRACFLKFLGEQINP